MRVGRPSDLRRRHFVCGGGGGARWGALRRRGEKLQPSFYAKYAWRLWNLNYATEHSYKLTIFWNSSSLVLW